MYSVHAPATRSLKFCTGLERGLGGALVLRVPRSLRRRTRRTARSRRRRHRRARRPLRRRGRWEGAFARAAVSGDSERHASTRASAKSRGAPPTAPMPPSSHSPSSIKSSCSSRSTPLPSSALAYCMPAPSPFMSSAWGAWCQHDTAQTSERARRTGRAAAPILACRRTRKLARVRGSSRTVASRPSTAASHSWLYARNFSARTRTRQSSDAPWRTSKQASACLRTASFWQGAGLGQPRIHATQWPACAGTQGAQRRGGGAALEIPHTLSLRRSTR